MIFVVVYDRKAGIVLEQRRFADSELSEAKRFRQRCERHHAERSDEVEVVMLDAENEEALKQTHGRYFGGAEEMLERAAKRSGPR